MLSLKVTLRTSGRYCLAPNAGAKKAHLFSVSAPWNSWNHTLLRCSFGQRKRLSKVKCQCEYGPHAWCCFAMWWAPCWSFSWDNSLIRHLVDVLHSKSRFQVSFWNETYSGDTKMQSYVIFGKIMSWHRDVIPEKMGVWVTRTSSMTPKCKGIMVQCWPGFWNEITIHSVT